MSYRDDRFKEYRDGRLMQAAADSMCAHMAQSGHGEHLDQLRLGFYAGAHFLIGILPMILDKEITGQSPVIVAATINAELESLLDMDKESNG